MPIEDEFGVGIADSTWVLPFDQHELTIRVKKKPFAEFPSRENSETHRQLGPLLTAFADKIEKLGN